MTDFKTTAITSAMGAAAGLGGLTLVFLGVLIGTIQSYTGDTSKKVLEKYQRPALFVLIAFVLCMVSVALSFVWLLSHSSHCLYVIAVVAFFVALATVLSVAVVVVRQIVWRKK